MTFDFLGLKVARTRGNFEINFRLSNHNVPPVSSDYIYTTRPKAEFHGWMGLMDGLSKVLFNFPYTLWVYRSSICILIYIVKICHHYSYGFQNLMSSWGVGARISRLPFSHDFFKIIPKVRCLKNTFDNGPFFKI